MSPHTSGGISGRLAPERPKFSAPADKTGAGVKARIFTFLWGRNTSKSLVRLLRVFKQFMRSRHRMGIPDWISEPPANYLRTGRKHRYSAIIYLLWLRTWRQAAVGILQLIIGGVPVADCGLAVRLDGHGCSMTHHPEGIDHGEVPGRAIFKSLEELS